MTPPNALEAAIYAVLESCIVRRETPGEALTEARAAQRAIETDPGSRRRRSGRLQDRARWVSAQPIPRGQRHWHALLSLLREPVDLRPDKLPDALVHIG